MAKTYTIAEATKIIQEGKDMAAIQDIGGRYPLLAHRLATAAAGAGVALTDLMRYMPEYVSANKVNMAMKKDVGDVVDDGEDSDDTADEASAPVKPTKQKPVKPAAKGKPAPVETAEDDTDEYDGMSAQELFKACKKRGLKADIKKPSKYYADMLRKADAADTVKEEPSEEEEWAEEEVDEKPAAKGKPAKPAKPAKKDEDEDWDI